MSLILPNKKAQEIAEQTKRNEEMNYQKDMFKKLRDWALENSCTVIARVFPVNTESLIGTSSMLFFTKLSTEEKNELIKKLNQEENPLKK